MKTSFAPITVVILAKDEADNIDRCMESIAWCKEVILIDDSSDDTVEIAKKKLSSSQLRVISAREKTDFAFLRNMGLKNATNQWVLFLDADEVVGQALKEEIITEMRHSVQDGYYIRRTDFFLEKQLMYGETARIQLLKLGRRDAGRWTRRVHETWQIEGRTSTLRNALEHYPHPTVAEFLSRINRWTTLDAAEFKTREKRSSFLDIIAYPVGKFIRNFLVKQGFRDGMPGLIVAFMMSFHSFLTRAKLYMI